MLIFRIIDTNRIRQQLKVIMRILIVCYLTKGTKNTEELQRTENSPTSRVEEYTEYLRSKYGNVTIQSIGKDQASLNRAGKSMSGNDVIIAPNILEQMATNPEKAAYYEGK